MPAATELTRTNASRLVLLEPEPTEHTEIASMMPCCVSCVYEVKEWNGPESCLCSPSGHGRRRFRLAGLQVPRLPFR